MTDSSPHLRPLGGRNGQLQPRLAGKQARLSEAHWRASPLQIAYTGRQHTLKMGNWVLSGRPVAGRLVRMSNWSGAFGIDRAPISVRLRLRGMFALLRFSGSGWPVAVAAGLAFAAALAATGTAHSQTGSAIPPTAVPQPASVGTVGNAPGSDVQEPPAAKPADGAATIPANAPRVGPLPAGQVLADDYGIGAQDLLEIQVFGIDELKREVRVNSRGIISLPLIGPVVLAGLTSQDAEALIASKYAKDYLQDPQVSVFIKEFTSQRITLEGAVAKPGIYPIRGEITLMQAIALAGGQGQLPDLHEVLVYRREGGEK